MNLNEISSKEELADFLDIKVNYLNFLLFSKEKGKLYKTFSIPKSNGDLRIINSPNKKLKYIQLKIKEGLLKIINLNGGFSSVPNAYIEHRGVITNARKHVKKKIIVNLDIENFFDTFHFGRIQGYLCKNKIFKLDRNVSIMISNLVCYKNKLPQGAPTSPILSNAIFQIVDRQICLLCKKYKLSYTRYADDLTFSTNDSYFIDSINSFLNEINELLFKNGFKLNTSKTRIENGEVHKEVTGVLVNKKINVLPKFYKNTRAMAYHLYKNGFYLLGDKYGTLNQLNGRFAYINQYVQYNKVLESALKKKYVSSKNFYIDDFDINDYKMDSTPRNIYNLCAKERDYKNFLFYKNFLAIDKPLLITEGKTDNRYIKAALLKLNNKYTSLINNNSFANRYNINFFKRTKSLFYFFDLSKDGADAITSSIITTYLRNDFNYFNYFYKLSYAYPNFPVIALYDNETVSSSKPLYKLINNSKLFSKEEKNEILTKNFVRLKNTNLYILSVNLVKGKAECEIEDLFEENLLKLQLDGKKFELIADKNDKETYSKEIFSNFVLNNYKSINFDNFKPLIENIIKILQDYNTFIKDKKTISMLAAENKMKEELEAKCLDDFKELDNLS